MFIKGLVLRMEVSIQLILSLLLLTLINSAIIPNASRHVLAKIIYITAISRIQMHVDFWPGCTWFKINNSYVYVAS